MSGAEPSALALFWAGVIAASILLYVVLDGFDLGVGILFGTTRDAALRDQMIASIAPVWDGNETWLVVVAASLFACFPVVYAVFAPAFYWPVLLLLTGLIFRGVAFEFRERGRAGGLWDRGFFLGSALAAFVQGAAMGAMIRGIPVVDGRFAGGAFDWLAPLPALCGVGLMLGYALLGAGWLVLKGEGALQDWAWRRVPRLAIGMIAALGAATIAAFVVRQREAGALFVFGARAWGLVFALFGVAAIAGLFVGVRMRRERWPFAMTAVFFISAFASLAVMFWPYMIPYSITVAAAAAPESALRFFFWAGAIVLPVQAAHTVLVYRVFRGKLRAGYH